MRYYRIRFERSIVNGDICVHIVLPRREQKTRRNHILIIEFSATYYLSIPNNHKRITTLKFLKNCLYNKIKIGIEKEKERYPLKIPSYILKEILDKSSYPVEFKEVIKNYEYDI